jgi:hypothetical protein
VFVGAGSRAAGDIYFKISGGLNQAGDITVGSGNATGTNGAATQSGGTRWTMKNVSGDWQLFANNGSTLLIDITQAGMLTATNAMKAGGSITAQYGTGIPVGGSAGAGLLVSSTANFGMFFGSGAPTLSAAKGSLYLRSDGSATNNRAYINTDGATTWTAITTGS